MASQVTFNILVFFISLFYRLVNPQTFGCPSNWYTFAGSCYQFYADAPETFEDARVQCSTHGAGLVSVGSMREHDFISKWLQVNDPSLQQWYTSGIRESSGRGVTQFTWQGTGEVVGGPDQFWMPGRNFNLSTGVIVYALGDAGYRWSLSDPSDKLAYICEVPEAEAYRIIQDLRDYDYGIEQPDMNNLERGPHFLLQPQSTVVVGKPPTAELECVAMGNPETTYTWWRGENAEELMTAGMDKRYTITNGKLIITDPVESRDSGEYLCKAENKFGVIISSSVQLSFGDIGEFSNVPDAPVNAKAYEGAAIDCSRIAYKPAVKYQWFKRSTDQFVRPEFQKYMFMSQNGKLYFSEVTRADEGKYFCIAILSGINRYTVGDDQPPTRTSMPIMLQVHDQTPKADWGPAIQDEFIAVFPKPPLVGQDVRMECFAYGTATSEFIYTWSRESKPMPKSAFIGDHGRVLVIRDAKLEDQGVYTCFVRRGSSATDQKSMHLKLGAKPYFITPLKDQHADLGAQLTWRCDARANPAPSFMWLKNGKQLQSDPDKFLRVTNNVLIITKLDPSLHNGMYQCAATNNYGTSLTEGQLRVLAFAPNFRKNPLPPNTRAAIMGNLTLPCSPEGAPLPVITWFKNGAELPPSSSNIVQLSNGFLRILTVNKGDEGQYRCLAKNSLGEADDTTHLTVAEGTSITVPPQDQTAVINSTVFLFCHASHADNTDMVYRWLFNSYDIDVYRNPEYNMVHENLEGKTGLYIKAVNFYNSGFYECVATTTINSDRRGAYLTVVGPPSEPAGLAADITTVTNTSVVIKWAEGSDNGRAITKYIVEAANAFDENIWEVIIADLPAIATIDEVRHKRFANVTGLHPGCGYRFRVAAVNPLGTSPFSIPSAYVQTHSAPPIMAPTSVGGGDGSVGDLTMTWMSLTRVQQAGNGIGYRLYWRRHRGKEDDAWSVADLKGNVDHHVTLVGVQNYYLEYDFKIQAFNNHGFGPNSSVVVIMSAEDLPIATPTNVAAEGYNGTAMEVTWTPVPEIREYVKGKILGYQINYWHEEDEATDYKEFIRHEGQVDSGIVIGLVSDNFYYFTIQAYNSAGLGPVSEYYHQETLHAPLAQYPQEVRVYSAGAHAVDVWWRGIYVSRPEGNIYGFVVYYWPANEQYRTATQHVIHDFHAFRAHIEVEPGVVYALRVSAFGEGGFGKKSVTTYFALEGNNVLIDYSLFQLVEAFVASAPTSSISVVLVTISVAVQFLL